MGRVDQTFLSATCGRTVEIVPQFKRSMVVVVKEDSTFWIAPMHYASCIMVQRMEGNAASGAALRGGRSVTGRANSVSVLI